MKSASRLHFSTIARPVRAVLFLLVIIAWAVVILGMFPRGDKTPASGTERSAPSKRSHNTLIAVPV
jgi:hypothetical protein